jgi:hypothetical protein
VRRRHLIPFALIASVLTLTALVKGTPSPCTSTLPEGTTSATVNTTLKGATGGAVICLASGTYELLTISGANPASQVTLQAAPGAAVNVHGMVLSNGSGGVSRLTVSGINFTGAYEASEPPLGNVGHLSITGNKFGVNTTGSTETGSAAVTNIPSTSGMAVGEAIYATNISTNAANLSKISEINSSSEIHIEHAATSTATNEKIGVGPADGVFTKSSTAEGRVQEYTTVEHNTFSNLGPCPTENKACGTIGQCFSAMNGKQKHITFVHNVCGGNIPNHYVQIASGENIVVEHNTFLGPPKSETDALVHQNILQIFGSSSHVQFAHNVMWETGGSPSLLIEASLGASATYEDIHIEHNLWLNNTGSQAVNLCPIHGLTFQHNTVVGSQNGVLFHEFVAEPVGNSYDCLEGQEYTIEHNIAVGTHSGSDLGVGGCESVCAIDYNASGDKSVESETHHVINWIPSWTTTIWSSPSEAFPDPPTGYYIPVGLGIEAGYVGGGGV